jgi:DNA-binding transcriptional LysR family regulator
MTDVDRRHLEAFVAIADAGSISAAAQAMHISQSAVSRTLAQLEALLGESLIERSTHHLELSPAGVRFLGPARDAIQAIEQAVAAARNDARPLRFGHSWATSDRAADIARRWRERAGRCEVQLVFCEERIAGVERGVCDIGLGRGTVDDRDFRVAILAHEQRFAIVPSSHRFARRSALTLADLAGEQLIISTLGTTRLDMWPDSAQPSNPIWLNSTEEWLTAIAAGTGVGVTVESIVNSRPHPRVRYIPLADAEPVPLVLVFPRRPTHSATRAFVNAAIDS